MKSNFPQTFIYIFEINLSSNYKFKQECIPVGCVLPASVAIMGGLHTHRHTPLEQVPPWSRHPPGAGTPWVWAWRPPRCGPGDPWPDPSTSPLGVGLETCKTCWDTPPKPATRHAGIPPAMHVGIPPPCEQNHRHV